MQKYEITALYELTPKPPVDADGAYVNDKFVYLASEVDAHIAELEQKLRRVKSALVRQGIEDMPGHVTLIPVLPIDAEDERIVDELMKRRASQP